MKKISTLLLLILLAVPAAAQAKIVIASGAGYRSLVDKLTATYTAQSGNEIERVYGNMARVTAQARNSGSVDLVLGDKSFWRKQISTVARPKSRPGTTGYRLSQRQKF